MANIKSQIKRNRQNDLAHERNKAVKSRLKTAVRQFREAADAGDDERARELARTANRDLDKAARPESSTRTRRPTASRRSPSAPPSSEPAPLTGRHPIGWRLCHAGSQAGDVTRPDGPAPTTASTIRSSACPPSASAPLMAASALATASIARATPDGSQPRVWPRSRLSW